MNWFKRLFSISNTNHTSNVPSVIKAGIGLKFDIPEPTKSLLWITNEDVSNISHAGSIVINISFGPKGVTSDVDRGHNFTAEPSLMWTKLPVKRNSDLEQKPMYYPSYSTLSPEHRYQYLDWLQDVTKPTNLSYVFLYYYGLERHLLVGNYEAALAEIVRLLQFHDKGSFRSYAQSSLMIISLHKKNLDLFKNQPSLLSSISNEVLLIRKLLALKITSKEIMSIARQVGLENTRYIKINPDQFEAELEKLVVEFEYKHGSLLEQISNDELNYEEYTAFANMSLPDNVRRIKVPQLLSNGKFKLILKRLLEEAHQNLKDRKNIRKQKDI